jgi:hypothetical protein
MPKLPLFPKDDPLNQEAVAALRELFANPGSNEALSLIDDLLDLHATPEAPMSEALAFFTIPLAQFNNAMSNWLINSRDSKLLTRKAQCMRIEINDWLLRHAEAAGFLPCDKHDSPSPPCQTAMNLYESGGLQ